jgi:hypothetical protein
MSEFFAVGPVGNDRNAVVEATAYMTLLVRMARDAYQKFCANLDLSPGTTLAGLEQSKTTLEQLEREFGCQKVGPVIYKHFNNALTFW